MKIKRYTTIFPQAENIHLIKDIGMISFLMQLKYGVQGEVVTYNNDHYSYLEGTLKGLKLTFLKRLFHVATLDVCLYLFFQARKIDFLQLFHLRFPTLVWILVYRMLNPRGKIYLKLDPSNLGMHKMVSTSLRRRLFLPIIRLCSLVSVETKDIQKEIEVQWGLRTTYLPNGIYNFEELTTPDFPLRETSICTVGRIGFSDKGHHILLKAFKLFHPRFPQYILKFIGPIEEEFKSEIDSFLRENDFLANSVKFLGPIYDRSLLRVEMQKSKIFCSSSIRESFGIANIEAMDAGCCLVSTTVLATNDITDNGKLAFLCPPGDAQALANSLSQAASNEKKMQELSKEGQKFIRANFYWPVVVEKIAALLQIA
ncbi:MAG: hypothetical protein A2X86_12270 [Bdellovibrionales bacterium GWA2_49_15]|nr:MAG: hypothetical protein A2X86_12270 [Bdellovibrionales bacterium GWA2_49_15]